jgi:hypothetical protein
MSLFVMPLAADLPEEIIQMRARGEYTAARERLAELAAETQSAAERDALLFEAERLRRVALDFDLTEEDLLERLRDSIPDLTTEDIARWRDEYKLQGMIIDGEMRHFKRDPTNLFRVSAEARERRDAARAAADGGEPEVERQSRLRKLDAGRIRQQHVEDVIRIAHETGESLVMPRRYHITYTLTVNPGEVPEGETIRCWLLCPREEPHQTDFRMIRSQPEEHFVAPPDTPQRTIYLEQPSRGGEPTEFQVEYEYTAWAFHPDIDPDATVPYDTDSEEYRRFTAEEPPHIVFSPRIRQLTQEIVGDETNPYLKARRIFDWINDNIPWIGEREYSTILNIPELSLDRMAGDCGVHALTFITLCRAAGVPARWESGWYPRPLSPNMHDWAKFKVEPYGWLWADADMGHHPDWNGEEAQTFYFGGVDGYRLVANSAYSQPLVPPKEHFRSETVDFQRGEVEWSGGNLYFDQWAYNMDIQVLE